MAPNVHSKLGASSASMWMNCPGSVRLCAGIPNTPSKYTSLGTAAHELGERCLLDGTNAHDHLGEKITADGKPHPVDVDMADAVQVYIEEIRGDIIQALDLDLSVLDGKSVLAALEKSAAIFGVEARFHLEWLHPDLFGTNDANFGVPLDVLRVYDYKHGQGVAVEVEDNPQLKYYALGALAAFRSQGDRRPERAAHPRHQTMQMVPRRRLMPRGGTHAHAYRGRRVRHAGQTRAGM